MNAPTRIIGTLALWLVGLLAALAALATLTGFLARLWWLLEPTSHFRVQYFVVLLVAALVFLAVRRWPLAVAAALFSLVNLAVIIPLYVGRPTEPGPPRYRLVMANIEYVNHNYDRVRAFLDQAAADFLILQEFTPAWQRELAYLEQQHQCAGISPREDAWGIAFYSRLPCDQFDIRAVGPSRYPSTFARLALDGRLVTIVGTHPPPPLNEQDLQERDQQLAAIVAFAHSQPDATLVCGDFNITLWSPVFARFLVATELRAAGKGSGVYPTWPADYPPLMVPFDHCLVSEEVLVHAYDTGPHVGSDHYPIVLDFSLLPAGTTAAPRQ